MITECVLCRTEQNVGSWIKSQCLPLARLSFNAEIASVTDLAFSLSWVSYPNALYMQTSPLPLLPPFALHNPQNISYISEAP